MKSVLLIGSHILGNSTASRRFREVISSIQNIEVQYISISQREIDEYKIPRFLKNYQSIPTYLVLRAKLLATARDRKYDLIVSITPQPLLAIHGLFHNSPIVLWYDGLPQHANRGLLGGALNFMSKLLYSPAFRRVKLLLPMSKWADSQRSKFKPLLETRSVLAPICVSSEIWTPRRNDREQEKHDKIRVLMVGNDANKKGYIDFFNWCILNNKNLSFFRFKIISNERNPILINLARNLEIEIIDFLSHDNIDELARHYHNSDIFFHPTKADMMPNVLIEAAASRLPIIAADIGAINEIVSHGITGWLAPPRDWPQFYERLMEFVEHPDAFRKVEILKNSERFLDKSMHITIENEFQNLLS